MKKRRFLVLEGKSLKTEKTQKEMHFLAFPLPRDHSTTRSSRVFSMLEDI